MKINGQNGQVFLIVLLVSVIVMTVGLSVASRNIVSLRITQEEKDSQRALAAAEAGVEQSLKTEVGVPITSFSGEPGATFSTSVSEISGTQFLVLGNNIIPKDEGADIWLVPHDSDDDLILTSPWTGNLTIYWGTSSDVCDPDPSVNTMAAIEVAVISGAVISPSLTRYAFDPCVGRRSTTVNNFSAAFGGDTVNGTTFSYSTSLISITSGFLVKVIPLYANAAIGARGSIALPSQGIVIDSTGRSDQTRSTLKIFKGYPSLPVQYSLYGLFSP